MRRGWAIVPRGEYPHNWEEIARQCKEEAGRKCIRCGHPHNRATGHVLTVHHANGDKSDCRWFNLLPLCQRCHLVIQAKVDPSRPYILEHSEWYKPYVAAFYAEKYLGQSIGREEAISRMDELLGLECQGKQGVLL